MQTEAARSAAPARTEEMAVIHRIFRRGFPMMAELVRQTPTDATARSEPIAAHLDFLQALATALDEFTAALVGHLDDEEAHVVPLLRVHITADEWTRFGQETFEKFTNPEKLVATGTLEEVATPEEARWFLGDLPLPIKLMWRHLGRRKYARYMRRVVGTAA